MSRFLPTPLELRAMPPRAVIAFAVRCCRRIQPLYDLPHDQPHPTSLEAPLCAAEAFARGEGPVDPAEATRIALALAHAANAAHYAAHAWSCMEPWEHHHRNDPAANAAAAYSQSEAAEHRRRAGEEAVEAARVLAESALPGDIASLGAQIARIATHVTATHVAVKTRPAVAAEFSRLSQLFASPAADTSGEPFDPSESGPLGSLWPLGEPTWATVKQ